MAELNECCFAQPIDDKIDNLPQVGTSEPLNIQDYICFPYDGAFPFMLAPPPDFFNARPVAKRTLSSSEATVRTPPMMAHVLVVNMSWVAESRREGNRTYDVMKWAKDCRVSEWTTRIGEISKLKKAP